MAIPPNRPPVGAAVVVAAGAPKRPVEGAAAGAAPKRDVPVAAIQELHSEH